MMPTLDQWIKAQEGGEEIKALVEPKFEEFLEQIRAEYPEWRIDFSSADYGDKISVLVCINNRKIWENGK
jgi:hypothetical protein